MPSVLKAQSPNHWTANKVFFFFHILHCERLFFCKHVCVNLPGQPFLRTSFVTPVVGSHEVLIACAIGMVTGLFLH